MSKNKPTVWVNANDLTEDETLGVLGLARSRLVKVGDCLEWGFVKTSGNTHSVALKAMDKDHQYRVFALDVLMKDAGKPISPISRYQRTCGNPRCMNPEHCYMKEQPYPEGEESSSYRQDFKLATEMNQWGWAKNDIIFNTSGLMANRVQEQSVEVPADYKDRQPLTYGELLKVAHALASIGMGAVNVEKLTQLTGLDYQHLLRNGAAVKAIHRRMTTDENRDAVIWFLTYLCEGCSIAVASEKANKSYMYGTQFLGACYGP